MKIKIYTDGGCLGNHSVNGTRKSYYSYKIFCGDTLRLSVIQQPSDAKTNNEAEFVALISALKACREFVFKSKCGKDITGIDVFMDSKLVVNSVMGGWKITKPELAKLLKIANELFWEIYNKIDINIYWVTRDLISLELGH